MRIRQPGLSAFVIGGVLQACCISAGFLPLSAQIAPQTSHTTVGALTPAHDASEPLRDYKPEDGFVGPRVIYARDPEFTDKARSKKLDGTCVLSMLVDAQGLPQDVRIVKSLADGRNPKLRKAALSLDQSAVKAAQQYRFEPATLKGKPVPYRLNVEVAFRIY